MSIPDNITKFHVNSAIAEIKKSPIPEGRGSYRYFLLDDDVELPPKYIVSIANKYANGVELSSKEFNAIQADGFLKKLGFNVIHKKEIASNQVKYWIEKTIVKGRPDRESGTRSLGRAIWSPQQDRRGADIYKNMRKVKPGDLILHLTNNREISGVSIAATAAKNTIGIEGTDWTGPSYLIELDSYIELNPKLAREKILNESNRTVLNIISRDSEVFYNTKLDLRQGAYLTPCSSQLLTLINQTYYKTTQKHLPHVGAFQEAIEPNSEVKQAFSLFTFFNAIDIASLKFKEKLIKRFAASVLTKPFLILSGLSGSGKTKLAQAFVQWICRSEEQYKIVPVGADWTNREPLLGYPNALNQNEYIKPDNGVVDLILHARDNKHLPYFLILDEMNLSHVERYFADFLSVMESNGKISFHSGDEEKSGVPASVSMPDNLFIIGTINVDETTYMFSPKVLDRANVIEFRISEKEIEEFLKSPLKPDLKQLAKEGAGMAESFLDMARTQEFKNPANGELNKTLVQFFGELKKTGAEFGYRSAYEIHRLINQLTVIDSELKDEEKLDIAIMQKLLPKLHGSRRKLCPVLVTLGGFCVNKEVIKDIEKVFEADDFDFKSDGVKYPLSLEKIARMHQGAVDNGFASYAEA